MDQHCRGWVRVNSENSVPAIREALRAGAFYSSCGPEIEDFYVENGVAHVRCSDAAEITLRQLRALMDGTIRQLHHTQELAGIHQLTYPLGCIPPGNDLRAVHITGRSARRDADAGCIVPCAVGLSVYHQAISAPVVLRKVRCKNVQWQLLHKIHANAQPEVICVAA